MANTIAKIRLAPGETGYYDEISNISLNWRRTEAEVREGTDCRGLRASVAARRLIVIEGDLGRSKTFKQVLMEKKAERTGQSLESLMGDTSLAYEAKAPQEKEPKAFQATTPDPVVVEDEEQKTTTRSVTTEETPEETATEEVTVTAKPTSIRSLKVGASREIEISHDVTAAESSDEEILCATFDGNTVTVEGVKEGKATLSVTTAKGSISVPVTVVAA